MLGRVFPIVHSHGELALCAKLTDLGLFDAKVNLDVRVLVDKIPMFSWIAKAVQALPEAREFTSIVAETVSIEFKVELSGSFVATHLSTEIVPHDEGGTESDC